MCCTALLRVAQISLLVSLREAIHTPLSPLRIALSSKYNPSLIMLKSVHYFYYLITILCLHPKVQHVGINIVSLCEIKPVSQLGSLHCIALDARIEILSMSCISLKHIQVCLLLECNGFRCPYYPNGKLYPMSHHLQENYGNNG